MDSALTSIKDSLSKDLSQFIDTTCSIISLERSISQHNCAVLRAEVESITVQLKNVSNTGRKASVDIRRLESAEAKIKEQDAIIKQLEKNIDLKKGPTTAEFNRLKLELATTRSDMSQVTRDYKNERERVMDLEQQIMDLEGNESRFKSICDSDKVSSLEQEVSELKNEIHAVTLDRDELLKKIKFEIERGRELANTLKSNATLKRNKNDTLKDNGSDTEPEDDGFKLKAVSPAISKTPSRNKNDAEVADLNSIILKKESEISDLKGTNRKLESEISDLKGSNRKLESDISDVKGSNRKHESDISDFKTSNRKLESVISDLKTSNRQQASEISDLKSTIKENHQEISSLNSRLAKQSSTIKILESQQEEISNLESIHHKISQTPYSLKNLVAAIHEISLNLSCSESKFKDLKLEKERVDGNNSMFDAQLKQSLQDSDSYKLKVSNLLKEINMIESTHKLEITALESKLHNVNTSLSELNEIHTKETKSLQKSHSQEIRNRDSIIKDLSSRTGEVDSLLVEIQTLQEKVISLKTTNQDTIELLDDERDVINRLKSVIEEYKSDILKLEKEKQVGVSLLELSTLDNTNLQKDISTLQNTVKSLSNDKLLLEKEIKTLRREIDRLKKYLDGQGNKYELVIKDLKKEIKRLELGEEYVVHEDVETTKKSGFFW